MATVGGHGDSATGDGHITLGDHHGSIKGLRSQFSDIDLYALSRYDGVGIDGACRCIQEIIFLYQHASAVYSIAGSRYCGGGCGDGQILPTMQCCHSRIHTQRTGAAHQQITGNLHSRNRTGRKGVGTAGHNLHGTIIDNTLYSGSIMGIVMDCQPGISIQEAVVIGITTGGLRVCNGSTATG